MKTFHHGGRIGDLTFALYTMKMLGGGKLYLSDFHRPSWDLEIAGKLVSLLKYQEYVKEVELIHYEDLARVDYDLHDAERDYNREAFPECTEEQWPGERNIAKRYAVHFGVEYPPKKPWLRAPKTMSVDVTIHAPKRRSLRLNFDWHCVYCSLVEQGYRCEYLDKYDGYEFLISADYINSAKCFVGTVSSCNAIAEGLGKRRLVEHMDGCWNVTPDIVINGLSNDAVVEKVKEICNRLQY